MWWQGLNVSALLLPLGPVNKPDWEVLLWDQSAPSETSLSPVRPVYAPMSPSPRPLPGRLLCRVCPRSWALLPIHSRGVTAREAATQTWGWSCEWSDATQDYDGTKKNYETKWHVMTGRIWRACSHEVIFDGMVNQINCLIKRCFKFGPKSSSGIRIPWPKGWKNEAGNICERSEVV